MHSFTHIVSGDTQHTHTHMQLGVGGIDLLHFPILASSPRDSQEQWAASDAAPGDQVQVPGPVLVRDRTEGHLFFLHVFVCYGVLWGEPGRTRGEHTNSTQKGPGTSPNMLHDVGLEPTTFLLWGNSATHWARV